MIQNRNECWFLALSVSADCIVFSCEIISCGVVFDNIAICFFCPSALQQQCSLHKQDQTMQHVIRWLDRGQHNATSRFRSVPGPRCILFHNSIPWMFNRLQNEMCRYTVGVGWMRVSGQKRKEPKPSTQLKHDKYQVSTLEHWGVLSPSSEGSRCKKTLRQSILAAVRCCRSRISSLQRRSRVYEYSSWVGLLF